MTARAILAVILGLNWAVAGAKILVGRSLGSLALEADGYHSLLDGFSNVMGLVSLSIAAQPADEDHPYGHHKFETLATLGVSVLIFLTAWEVLQDASRLLLSGKSVSIGSDLGIAVVLVTLVVNVFVAWWERREGRRLDSDFLLADATHTLSDVMVSLTVLSSLVMARLGHGGLDPWIALLIGLFIARIGWQLMLRTMPVLVDAEALPREDVEASVVGVEGIESCHKIRSRGRTGEIYVDLHIQVDPAMPIEEAHQLSHVAKDRVMARWTGVRDVIIHIEPGFARDRREPGADGGPAPGDPSRGA